MSIFQPLFFKCRAATSASPPLWPLPTNTRHFPGHGKNCRTTRATLAPACSISFSTSTPRAKAASSAARICAEVKMGESNQSPVFFGLDCFFEASSSLATFDLFVLEDVRFDFLVECLEREISRSYTLV